MEYILGNTDIFDQDIDVKFRKIIMSNLDKFNNEKSYELTVSFDVNLLNDLRFDTFHSSNLIKKNKSSRKEIIHDVLSYQLDKLDQILTESGIKSFSTTIQGDDIEAVNIIKIKIAEDDSQPIAKGRGKNNRIKVSSIVPSIPAIREKATNIAAESLSKIFHDFVQIIGDKKMLSEILEIENTEDSRVISEAFMKQYGDLCFTKDKEREKELLDKLKERSLTVLNEHIAEEEKREGRD